jgi:hypothetical protein
LKDFWGAHYFPELLEVERKRFPKIEIIVDILGGTCEAKKIPVPLDCVDGFIEAFYGRPEALLEKVVRQAQSSWGFLEKGMEDVLVKRLADDLASGGWDKKYGKYRSLPSATFSMTLVIAKP